MFIRYYAQINGVRQLRKGVSSSHDKRSDLLYIRLDESRQDAINECATDDVVMDIGKGDWIVGIEILDASSHVNLSKILPIHNEGVKVSA